MTPKERPSKDPRRLRAAWEHLMEMQQANGGGKRPKAIASVDIDETSGSPVVIIKTVNGGVIADNGEKKDLYHYIKTATENGSADIRSRLKALMDRILAYGWDAAVSGLSAREIALLRKKCREQGIPLSRPSASPARKESQGRLIQNLTAQRDDARMRGKLPKPGKFDLLAKRIRDRDRSFVRAERTQSVIKQTRHSLLVIEKQRFDSVMADLRRECNDLQLDEWRGQLYGAENKAAVIDRKIKDGVPLSQEEDFLNEKRKTYGLSALAGAEKPDEKQKAARAKMTADDYSKMIAGVYGKKALRKKGIYKAKAQALAAVCESEAYRDLCGQPVMVDAEDIRKKAYAKIPVKEELTPDVLDDVNRKMIQEVKERRAARKKADRRMKERICEKLAITRLSGKKSPAAEKETAAAQKTSVGTAPIRRPPPVFGNER